jgi:polar amino acid transport system substrate-binding protein
VLTQEYVLFVHKDSAFRFDGNLASLANVKLGVTASNSYGPSFDEALRQGQFRHLQTAYDHEHLFRMLVAGRIEVAICSKVVGQAFIHAIHADDQVVVADPAVMTAYSYLVFTRQRDFTELARVFEQTLVAMRRDGTLAKLLGENTRLGTSNH